MGRLKNWPALAIGVLTLGGFSASSHAASAAPPAPADLPVASDVDVKMPEAPEQNDGALPEPPDPGDVNSDFGEVGDPEIMHTTGVPAPADSEAPDANMAELADTELEPIGVKPEQPIAVVTDDPVDVDADSPVKVDEAADVADAEVDGEHYDWRLDRRVIEVRVNPSPSPTSSSGSASIWTQQSLPVTGGPGSSIVMIGSLAMIIGCLMISVSRRCKRPHMGNASTR